MKLFYLLAALLCSQYSPITTYAISRQLEEERLLEEEYRLLLIELVFCRYKAVKQSKAVNVAIQSFKPHYKRGGSKYF